jgi:hypothetical protein
MSTLSETGEGGLSHVTMCATGSLFVQVTVTPFAPGKATEIGRKVYPDMETAALLPAPGYPAPTIGDIFPYVIILQPVRAAPAMNKSTIFRTLMILDTKPAGVWIDSTRLAPPQPPASDRELAGNGSKPISLTPGPLP